MKRLLGTILFGLFVGALGVSGHAFAESERETPLGDASSMDWQRLKLEDMAQSRAGLILATLTGGHDYFVQANIVMKAKRPVAETVQTSQVLSLGKLDMSVETRSLTTMDNQNIFDFIERVEVVVTVPEGIYQKNQDLFQKSISESLRSLFHTPVTVQFAPLHLATKETDQDESESSAHESKDKDVALAEEGFGAKVLGELLKQALPLTVLLGSMFLVAVLSRLISVYRSVEVRKIEASAELAARTAPTLPAENERPERERTGGGGLGAVAEALGSTELSQIDLQIREAVSTSPGKFLTLIRRWLASDEPGSIEILGALPTILSMNSLLGLVAQLDESAKRNWRAVFERDFEEGFETRARLQIFQQLITGVMDEASPVSEEIRLFLDGIRPDECAEVAQLNQNLGSVLAKILSLPQTVRMLSLMPEDIAGQVAADSLDVSNEQVERSLPDLRQMLDKVRFATVDTTQSPVSKAIDLVTEAGPQKEAMLFSSFSRKLNGDDLQRLVHSVYPVEVILQAPTAAHRKCLSDMTLAQRANLIYTLGKSPRALMMSCYSPEEKISELLEAELTQIDLDAARKQRVQRDADKMWRTYITQFRKLGRGNSEIEEGLAPLLLTWLEKLQAVSAGKKNGKLHAA